MEEGVVLVISFVIVMFFVVDYQISKEFQRIAKLKGFHESRYFWYPFWLPLVGYLMVIALPDHSTESSYDNRKQLEEVSPKKEAEVEQEHLPEL